MFWNYKSVVEEPSGIEKRQTDYFLRCDIRFRSPASVFFDESMEPDETFVSGISVPLFHNIPSIKVSDYRYPNIEHCFYNAYNLAINSNVYHLGCFWKSESILEETVFRSSLVNALSSTYLNSNVPLLGLRVLLEGLDSGLERVIRCRTHKWAVNSINFSESIVLSRLTDIQYAGSTLVYLQGDCTKLEMRKNALKGRCLIPWWTVSTFDSMTKNFDFSKEKFESGNMAGPYSNQNLIKIVWVVLFSSSPSRILELIDEYRTVCGGKYLKFIKSLNEELEICNVQTFRQNSISWSGLKSDFEKSVSGILSLTSNFCYTECHLNSHCIVQLRECTVGIDFERADIKSFSLYLFALQTFFYSAMTYRSVTGADRIFDTVSGAKTNLRERLSFIGYLEKNIEVGGKGLSELLQTDEFRVRDLVADGNSCDLDLYNVVEYDIHLSLKQSIDNERNKLAQIAVPLILELILIEQNSVKLNYCLSTENVSGK